MTVCCPTNYFIEPLEKAFLDAAENNKLDELKRLLSINPNLLTCCDKDGYTALHRACYADNIDIVNVTPKSYSI